MSYDTETTNGGEYRVDLHCVNCGKYFNDLGTLRGTLVKDRPCPNCGTQQLIKA